MKKLLTTIVSLIMVVVMAAFVGCGGGNKETGVIKGDYKEATADDVATQLNGINTDNLLGDMTADDWSQGLSLYLDLSMDEFDVKGDINFQYDIVMSFVEDELKSIGKGSLSANMPDEDGKNVKSKGDVYSDADYIYVDAGEEGKMKISIDAIMTFVIEALLYEDSDPVVMSVDEDETEPGDEEGASFADMIGMLDEMGITFAMDTSDGIKIKMVADATVVLGLLGGATPMMAVTDASDIFEKCVVEFYLHISEDGQLVAFTANVDVAMDMGEDLGEMSLSLVMAIRTTAASNIQLPAGIATDEEYMELPLSDIIGA